MKSPINMKSTKTQLTLLLLTSMGLNASWLWKTHEDQLASQVGYYKIETSDLASSDGEVNEDSIKRYTDKSFYNLENGKRVENKSDDSFMNADLKNDALENLKKSSPEIIEKKQKKEATDGAGSGTCGDCEIESLKKKVQILTDENEKNSKTIAELSQKKAEEKLAEDKAKDKDAKTDDDSDVELDYIIKYALEHKNYCLKGAAKDKDSKDNIDPEDVTFSCALTAFERRASQKDVKKDELKTLFDLYIKPEFNSKITDADEYSELTGARDKINSMLGKSNIAKKEIKKSLLALRNKIDIKSAEMVKNRFEEVDSEFYDGEDARDFASEVLADLEGKDSVAVKKIITNMIAKYDKSKLDTSIQEKYFASQDLKNLDPVTASLLLREFQVDRVNFLNTYAGRVDSLSKDFAAGLDGQSRGLALNEFRNSYIESMAPYLKAFKSGDIENLSVPRLSTTLATTDALLLSGSGLTSLPALGGGRKSRFNGSRSRLDFDENISDKSVLGRSRLSGGSSRLRSGTTSRLGDDNQLLSSGLSVVTNVNQPYYPYPHEKVTNLYPQRNYLGVPYKTQEAQLPATIYSPMYPYPTGGRF